MTNAALAGMSILVVDDEVFIAANLEGVLQGAGASTRHAATAQEARAALDEEAFDAAILDVHLSDGSSYPLADRLRAVNTPFVFLSGYLTVREGYTDIPFLEKPFSNEQVIEAMTRITAKQRNAS